MTRNRMLCIAAVVLTVGCSDELPEGKAAAKTDSPMAPSFNIEPTPNNSTICKAYTRELVSAKAALQRRTVTEEVRASVSALEAMTADVCS